jgi:hypothetical protein
MSPERTSTRSRRAILASAAGAAAVFVARAVDRPGIVRAAGDDGANIQVGSTFTDVQAQTTLTNRANNNRVLYAFSSQQLGNGNGVALTGNSSKSLGVEGVSSSGTGVHGHSATGVGVRAEAAGTEYASVALHARHTGSGVLGTAIRAEAPQPSGWGVQSVASGSSGVGVIGDGGMHGVLAYGSGMNTQAVLGRALSDTGDSIGVQGDSGSPTGTGVLGHAPGTGVLGVSYPGGGTFPSVKAKTGVYGFAVHDGSSRGVWGRSNAGRGVFGEATSGVGLYGSATTGHALRSNGRVRFDKVSGVATLAAGVKTVTINPGVTVTSSSFVLLTPKSNLGTSALWFTTSPTNGTISIKMSPARTAAVKIAWLLIG